MNGDGRKVLVTGGAGYIGSILVPTLLDAGFQVTVLDTLAFNQASLLQVCNHPKFDFIKGDVCNERLMTELVPKHEVIIPLAAIVGAPACDANPVLAKLINFDSVQIILKNARPEQKILFPTTNSGYG